jgi:hypothetical protein
VMAELDRRDGAFGVAGASWSTTGLRLPAELSFEKWRAVGWALGRIHTMAKWALADWINYGEAAYGEKYADALEVTQRSKGGLMNIASVGRRVAASRRRDALSFTHHEIVAALDPDEQTKWLDQAEANRWSVEELRGMVRGTGPNGPLGPDALSADERELVDGYRGLREQFGDAVDASRVNAIAARRLEREQREDEVRRGQLERLAASAAPHSGERYQLIHGDIADVELEPESIDVIVSDPPYPAEFLHCYRELGRFADRVLKPGGSCLAMAGQAHLLDAAALMREQLTYVWTLGYGLPGRYQQIWAKKIWVGWKPVLWFAKGELSPRERWLHDRLVSPERDKVFHEWGQSVGGMVQLVERFSDAGDVVCDPFVGGGATAVAAVASGRRFVGIDVDEQAIRITAARIEAGPDAR